MFDLLGNELKEGDVICTRVTEMTVGRIVKIQEEGVIGKVSGGVMLDVPGEVVMLVELRRRLLPGTKIVDVVKTFQDKNKPITN